MQAWWDSTPATLRGPACTWRTAGLFGCALVAGRSIEVIRAGQGVDGDQLRTSQGDAKAPVARFDRLQRIPRLPAASPRGTRCPGPATQQRARATSATSSMPCCPPREGKAMQGTDAPALLSRLHSVQNHFYRGGGDAALRKLLTDRSPGMSRDTAPSAAPTVASRLIHSAASAPSHVHVTAKAEGADIVRLLWPRSSVPLARYILSTS
jgi:hypothetical protein